MNDNEIIDRLGGTAAVARRVNARLSSVSEWRVNGIPESRRIQLGAEIEHVGGPSRFDSRPSDWHLIWPELIGAEGAPAVPQATAPALA
jgi:hypothetical protein